MKKDVDEEDILAITKMDIEKNTLVIPYYTSVKDIELMNESSKKYTYIRSIKRKTKCI